MPESRPLDLLAARLLALGPPSISALLGVLLPAEGFNEFLELVREFLPDDQAAILAGDSPAHQVAIFANRFEDRYFPLPWFEDAPYNDLGYLDLVGTVPIYSTGISWDDWHEVPYYEGIGQRLLLCFIASPWALDDNGARLAAVQSCRGQVPDQLLERLPPQGYRPGELHRWLDDTRYFPLAVLADVVWHETGILFLDCDESDGVTATWDRETVEELARQWLVGEQMHRDIASLEAWLDADPAERLRELLDFIERRRETPSLNALDPPTRENIPLIDVFDEGERR